MPDFEELAEIARSSIAFSSRLKAMGVESDMIRK